MTQTIEYTLSDISAVAQVLLNYIQDFPVWTLEGELGAGKTTLVAEVAALLQVENEVSSPTYALVNEYPVPNNMYNIDTIYHMDLYRLKDVQEVFDAGIDEILTYEHTLKIIEWPAVAAAILPNKILSLNILQENELSRILKINLP